MRQMYQDTAGPTGLSPYQIVYGRERHNAGVPYEQVCGVKNLYVPGSFGSVDYTLAPSVRARGLKVLGLAKKDLLGDLFADAENARGPCFVQRKIVHLTIHGENSMMRSEVGSGPTRLLIKWTPSLKR